MSGDFAQSPALTDSACSSTIFDMFRICAKTSCATLSVLYPAIFVTAMPRDFAHCKSTLLYPVARTPIYFKSGRASICSLNIGTLFVRTATAPEARSMILSLGVRS